MEHGGDGGFGRDGGNDGRDGDVELEENKPPLGVATIDKTDKSYFWHQLVSEIKLPTSLQSDLAASATLDKIADQWNVSSTESSASAAAVETPFVILIHGFFASPDSDWVLGMRDAFVRFHKAKVLRVGWDTSPPDYLKAVADSRIVGAEIGLLIVRLAAQLPPEQVPKFLLNIHIIGHSLGSHIASYAANFVEDKLGYKIGRITALDPAGPAFQFADPQVRIDKDDALFVDAIHTDAAADFITGWGMEQAVGHVDFYPNGGQNQPGCVQQQINVDLLKLNGESFGQLVVCHHKRACYYFLETIIPKNIEVKIEKQDDSIFLVQWAELKMNFSVFDLVEPFMDGSLGNPQNPDNLALTLTRGGAKEGVHTRGSCDFLGVMCNGALDPFFSIHNLDPFAEINPNCGATCQVQGVNQLKTPLNSTIPGRIFNTTLCVPMGLESILMTQDIEQFKKDNHLESLKMFLETLHTPPFCKI